MFSTLEDVKYCGGCPELWEIQSVPRRMFSTAENVQNCGGCPVQRRMFGTVELVQNSGGCRVLWEDTISTVEDV